MYFLISTNVTYSIFCTLFTYRYIAAILEGHVVPAVPYISDAATYSPESCVFGQLINLGSVLCVHFNFLVVGAGFIVF